MVLMTRWSFCRKGKGANREMINRVIKPIKGVNIVDTKNQNKKDRP